jgi:seryl-tRNA synthetase
MIDPLFVRDHIDVVRTGLKNRGLDIDKSLEDIATFETARRRLIPEIEGLKRLQNTAGDEVARAKRQGRDTSDIQEANRNRSAQIKQLSVQLDSSTSTRRGAARPSELLTRPCRSQERRDNRGAEARQLREFDFEPKAHWDLGAALGIIDFECRAHGRFRC